MSISPELNFTKKTIIAFACVFFGLQASATAIQSNKSDGTEKATPYKRSEASGRFTDLDPNDTGITLVNQWKPEPLHSSLLFGVYGTGVAIGDFDADGLQDVFVAQQPEAGRLYRNLGNMKFEDVTKAVGIDPAGMWCTGTTFVDINNDGQLDLYLCGFHCPNRLYINEGGKFTERAKEYGLDFDGASVSMLFSDYDRDGDLDAYLVTNFVKRNENTRRVRPIRKPGQIPEAPEGYKETFGFFKHPDGNFRRIRTGQYDHLFRNDGDKFVDVTEETGIGKNAQIGLSANWWDYNNDGWPDLYVSNDFRGPDFLFRNNGPNEKGKVTFTNVIETTIPHTPWFSMGSDFADINNDGRFDYLATDMAGSTHYRDKLSMGEMSGQDSMLWFLNWPTPPQYMRNALYLNTGTSNFMEVAFLTGLARTDWTWTAKFADFDNDGWEDIYFTNGMTRDTFNGDLRAKLKVVVKAYMQTGKKPLRPAAVQQGFWESQPPNRQENMAFQNLGNLKFKNTGRDWGLDHLGVNTGGAVGDLDNDGDLDLVITGFEERTRVYRNDVENRNSIRFKLVGSKSNRHGVGARLELTVSGMKKQTRYVSPTRGFMSSSELIQHFGVGDSSEIDSLTVYWPSGVRQQVSGLKTNTLHTIVETDYEKFKASSPVEAPKIAMPVFKQTDILSAAKHNETEYDDFARQPLLPNKYSQLGPGIAWADVDADGDDDMYLAGAAGDAGKLFLNNQGSFERVSAPWLDKDSAHEDMGALFVDVDGDSDLDLYVVSGGVECKPGDKVLQDRLYLNDGKGGFSKSNALPELNFSGGAVAATDFDRDGDVDIFVGGRVVPGSYPESPRSALLRNEKGIFKDASDEISKSLGKCGMVTSAVWSDVDGDDWIDLVLTFEWGPVRVYKNEQGKLVNTKNTGLQSNIGWFNSISAGDIDNDGDTDFVVGNFGLNTKYKANTETPAVIYYGDFEGTGEKRIVEAKFENGVCLPRRGLSCSSHAMPMVREKKPTFHDFAISDLSDIYTDEKLNVATKLEANQLRSAVLINKSTSGKILFEFKPLPRLAQASPIFGSHLVDVDADGNLDLLVAQNFYGPQRETGYMDGGLGLLLKGDGKGDFVPVPAAESGIVIPRDATSLTVTDLNNDGAPDFVVGKNNSTTMAFLNSNTFGKSTGSKAADSSPGKQPAKPLGSKIMLKLPNGKTRLHEVRAGGGYLSQSSSTIFGANAEMSADKKPKN